MSKRWMALLLLALGLSPCLAQITNMPSGAVSEATLKGTARTFTARQIFTFLGIPTCAPDPPVGACTSKDVCYSTAEDGFYMCEAASWVQVRVQNANTVDGKDSTDFAQLAGQGGGQTLNGGTAASENLTLESTTDVIKGAIIASDRLGIGDYVYRSGASPLLFRSGYLADGTAEHFDFTDSAGTALITIGSHGLAGSNTYIDGRGQISLGKTTATAIITVPTLTASGGITCTDCIALGSETSGNYAAGDAEAGAATNVNCTDCVALPGETSGDYVASVATTAPLTGGALGSEAAALTLGVSDATTLATGVIKLAGDLEGTAALPRVAPDAVALGTDTTGNYAAGDAEAGSATGVACSDCVALTAETSGNYVASVTTSSPLTGGSTSEGGTAALGISDATTLAVGVVQLAGDLTGTAAAPLIASDAVALGGDTTGNYVQSVATTAPLSGGAAGAEGNILTLSVGDAAAGAKGVIQLAGDLTGSAASPVIAADAVALGTDTTGNYAAGDAEGGNATGLACATCVDISSETNLAVSAPITLTGDTIGFDASNFCFPMAIAFNPDATTALAYDLVLHDTTTPAEAKSCALESNCNGFSAPAALTIKDLRVQVGTAVASGSWLIQVRENGITQISCTISSGTSCTDTNSAGIAAGNAMTILVTPTAPTDSTIMRVAFCVR